MNDIIVGVIGVVCGGSGIALAFVRYGADLGSWMCLVGLMAMALAGALARRW